MVNRIKYSKGLSSVKEYNASPKSSQLRKKNHDREKIVNEYQDHHLVLLYIKLTHASSEIYTANPKKQTRTTPQNQNTPMQGYSRFDDFLAQSPHRIAGCEYEERRIARNERAARGLGRRRLSTLYRSRPALDSRRHVRIHCPRRFINLLARHTRWSPHISHAESFRRNPKIKCAKKNR